jgi:hypothetical protein
MYPKVSFSEVPITRHELHPQKKPLRAIDLKPFTNSSWRHSDCSAHWYSFQVYGSGDFRSSSLSPLHGRRLTGGNGLMEVFMFRLSSFISVAFVVAVSSGQSFAGDDQWFFTGAEIANAYRYQQQFGARLRSPLEPQTCFQGKKDFGASYQGRRFVAPCRFVGETVRQLRELLESGAAKYLFPLDVDSADLVVPADVYASKYKQLPREEILPALLREPTLVAIYHTAVHLNPDVGDPGSGMSGWGKERAVAGFYDGRPNRALSPRSDGGVDYQPQGLVRLGSFTMMGHFLGELTFVANDTVVTFDLSFDNDRAAAPTGTIVTVRAAAAR